MGNMDIDKLILKQNVLYQELFKKNDIKCKVEEIFNDFDRYPEFAKAFFEELRKRKLNNINKKV